MNLKSVSTKLKLTFYGGAKSVTGANFMLESSDSKVLVDCGLYQGEKFYEERSCLEFAYSPAEVKTLLVTHAHADHIGRIPKLVHDGFKGDIYSTIETKEIAEIMFGDSLKFVLGEAEQAKTAAGGSPDASADASREKTEPIYTKEDIDRTMSLWKDIPYHKNFDIGGRFNAYFKDAGHILGSAIVEITSLSDNKTGKGIKVAFSGDLGNVPTPFLRDTENVTDADYLVIESVYGDRNHEDVEIRREKLKVVVEDIVQKKGTLLIPAFSVSRTQVLLHELNDLIENKKLPEVPVFLDSPLAIKVTEVYRRYQKNFKESTKDQIKGGDKIFDFPKLKFTPDVEDSKAINSVPGPKIIIAGSGMSNGGRILHHEKRYLPDPNTTLLFVGYQAPGSLGRVIQDGTKEVEIDETRVNVRAQIETITGYSGHMDSDHLIDFVGRAGESGKLKKVFVAMGEPKSSMFLVQRIKDYLDIEAVSPEEKESFELNF
jgi:metallo-beta-lactamase family protein